MKKLLPVLALVFAFSALGFSDPVSCSTVGSHLSDFISLGSSGCTAGNLWFSDFAFPTSSSIGGAIVPTASDVGVVTTSSGVTFDSALIAGQNQSADVVIDYIVRVLSGGPITGSSLTVNAGSSNGGMYAVDEVQCAGAMLPACSGGTVTTLNVSGNSALDTNTLSATSLSVSKDILVSGGTQAGGQASMSNINQTFTTTTVPEPASLMLFGLGLFGVAFAVRRETSTASK